MVYAPLIWDGAAVGGACDSSLPKDVIRSPWDGRAVGTIPEAGWTELNAAIDAASRAATRTRLTPPEIRAGWLRAFADEIDRERESLTAILVAEIAKPVRLARQEVTRAATTFRIAANAIERFSWTEPVEVGPDDRAADFRVTAKACGVGPVLAFVPYNWPINLLAHKLAAILATGNSAVVKLSSLAPIASAELIRIAHVAGVPDGVVNSWNGPNDAAQRAVTDPRIAAVSFTGSDRVGWMLRELAPRKPFVLELGGNSSAVIAPDWEDSDGWPGLVASAYAFAGQICISTQNVFVPAERLPRIAESVLAEAQALRVEDPCREGTVMSAMISEHAASAVGERALGLSADKCPTGVHRERNRLEPILTVGLAADHPLITEEIFGPVLNLVPYRNEQEVVQIFQSFRYRLQAAIYSHDSAWVTSLREAVTMGGWVVGAPPSTRFDAMPYGGEADSGTGREGSAYGFAPFLRWQSIIERR
jgi:acyl-CoA reductase-like NAD-dependent aldehyde dehydrogenase